MAVAKTIAESSHLRDVKSLQICRRAESQGYPKRVGTTLYPHRGGRRGGVACWLIWPLSQVVGGPTSLAAELVKADKAVGRKYKAARE